MTKKHNYPKDRKPTGPRPTAGRPKLLKEQVRVTISLDKEQREWCEAQGELSEVIRRLIDERRANDGIEQMQSLINKWDNGERWS